MLYIVIHKQESPRNSSRTPSDDGNGEISVSRVSMHDQQSYYNSRDSNSSRKPSVKSQSSVANGTSPKVCTYVHVSLSIRKFFLTSCICSPAIVNAMLQLLHLCSRSISKEYSALWQNVITSSQSLCVLMCRRPATSSATSLTRLLLRCHYMYYTHTLTATELEAHLTTAARRR
jgi:hypothetical protein